MLNYILGQCTSISTFRLMEHIYLHTLIINTYINLNTICLHSETSTASEIPHITQIGGLGNLRIPSCKLSKVSV
jgi:hypothetical protein